MASKDLIDNEELVAVIAAAIASSLNVQVPDINIKTIRRISHNISPWTNLGRNERLLRKF